MILMRSVFNLCGCLFSVFNVYLMSSANEITNSVVARQKQKVHITTNNSVTSVVHSMVQAMMYAIGCFVSNGYLRMKGHEISHHFRMDYVITS